MIHLIVGDEAAKNLEAAMELDENLRGEIIILKDNLANGPLVKSEDENHNTMRSNYWKKLMNQEDIEYIDENTIKLLIVRAEREEEPICFWLAPNGSDVCTYFWILPYFKSHPEMLHTINIIGLPFLNEKGQLFYPSHFAQVPAKEFIKTKRLLKEVTPAEYETEGDEWARLQEENTLVRIYDGGKKIISKPNTYFDTFIQNSLGADFQKAHKIVNEVLKKNTQFPPAAYIEWRIKEMIQENTISCKGDITKSARDYEIKKVGSTVEVEDAVAEEV